ncbi:Protein kinase domain, partial [Dillenia turbinata]
MQHNQAYKSLKDTEFFIEYGDANRYKLLEVIGKGSYGVVCAALDTHTGQKVAIKKIHDIFDHISDAIRILREVKLLRLLRHPDIVEIKRIMLPPSKKDFKDIFVVFELMESDLHQVIKVNDDLTREHHQFFLYQLLRALKYMHTANVYHRDLKPKNILANANCKLKICDFGLARVAFSDTPMTIFWTDYVATRWYRAPELCGSFYSKFFKYLLTATSGLQYTPAIDIWSIGCIFAEILTGKPLFPGKSIVHQLDLITDLLGTPSADTISRVRNEKARKYLMEMRKKSPVPFSQKFPKADPLALRLLERLLAFDPKDRPTAEEALSDPYFKGLAKVEREPACQPLSVLEFDFERRRATKEDIRELLFREILEYHPQMLKEYKNTADATNFTYPSVVGQFRKQFAHLQGSSGISGPVIPLERTRTSLPRSTFRSTAIPPKMHPALNSSKDQPNIEEAHKSYRVPDATSGNLFRAARPPPIIPTAKPGRVVGPVAPYVNDRSIGETSDARILVRSTVFPPQAVSPHCIFQGNAKNKGNLGLGAKKDTSVAKEHEAQFDAAAKPVSAAIANVNTNLCHQPQARADQLNDPMGIDAKLLQAQSQFGAAGAAAVAVAAHRK